METVQELQVCRVSMRRQFTSKSPGVPGTHLIDLPWKDERLNQMWNHLVVLDLEPLVLEIQCLNHQAAA